MRNVVSRYKSKGLAKLEVTAVIETHIRLTKGSKITNITDWSYQVKGVFGHSYTVALDNKVCSCKVFQKLKIPCGHALLVADYVGLPHVQLVGDCYKTLSWKDTLVSSTRRPRLESSISLPLLLLSIYSLLIPVVIQAVLKTNASPLLVKFRFQEKTKVNKCGCCGVSGHNRVNCKAPI
ncbi:hypothetical protein F2Q70_00042899 [Brassica cretica]|uniref:SWIM-type domain-containing protein n=1 Tax=Brassica cretica TaxID=69181 RepID=A0A8S9KLD3_BRACR|nr:hypothetical protein F2Q70_00042899 [Brassica cretica]